MMTKQQSQEIWGLIKDTKVAMLTTQDDGDDFIKKLEKQLEQNREQTLTKSHVVVEGEDLIKSLKQQIREKQAA